MSSNYPSSSFHFQAWEVKSNKNPAALIVLWPMPKLRPPQHTIQLLSRQEPSQAHYLAGQALNVPKKLPTDPGTYPRPSTTCLSRNSFILGFWDTWGMFRGVVGSLKECLEMEGYCTRQKNQLLWVPDLSCSKVDMFSWQNLAWRDLRCGSSSGVQWPKYLWGHCFYRQSWRFINIQDLSRDIAWRWFKKRLLHQTPRFSGLRYHLLWALQAPISLEKRSGFLDGGTKE